MQQNRQLVFQLKEHYIETGEIPDTQYVIKFLEDRITTCCKKILELVHDRPASYGERSQLLMYQEEYENLSKRLKYFEHFYDNHMKELERLLRHKRKIDHVVKVRNETNGIEQPSIKRRKLDFIVKTGNIKNYEPNFFDGNYNDEEEPGDMMYKVD